MSRTTEVTQPLRQGGPVRRVLVTLGMLRAIATVHGVAIFAQAVSAGRYLIGDYDMLAVHNLGAEVVFGLGLAQLVAALVLWGLGGPRWPSVVSLALALGEVGQVFAGLAGALDLHVPLGGALITGAVVMLVALWRPQVLGPASKTGSR